MTSYVRLGTQRVPDPRPYDPTAPVTGVPALMDDIKPFRSPIDGKEISSRSALREHEQRHGVRQVGDLKPHEFDNRTRVTESFKEKAFEDAFRKAVQKVGI